MTDIDLNKIDQDTEHWLEAQTRKLRMPDGSIREHTAFKLVWNNADALVSLSGFTMDQLVSYACEEAYLQNLSFDEAFEGIIAWLDDRQRKGIRIVLDEQ